jgi:hypothetical protein
MPDLPDDDDPLLDRESQGLPRSMTNCQRRAAEKSHARAEARDLVDAIGIRLANGEKAAHIKADLGIGHKTLQASHAAYVRRQTGEELPKPKRVQVLRRRPPSSAGRTPMPTQDPLTPAPKSAPPPLTHVRIRIELLNADGDTLRRCSRTVSAGKLEAVTDLQAFTTELAEYFWPLEPG